VVAKQRLATREKHLSNHHLDGGALLMKILTFLIIALSLFSQLDCSGERIDRSMVIGVYLANHDKGVDMLLLRSDSTFYRTYTTINGDQFSDSGTWEFLEGYTSRINFDGFRYIFDVQDVDKINVTITSWSTFFQKPIIGGKIKIAINEDEGYWYIKAGPR
jgi:hypothetical protein